MHNKSLPTLTVGFLSYNRLHYLRATLESARVCINYPNIQWIVVDNASNEPGLLDYLHSLGWIDELIVRRCSHCDAMNEIVAKAVGDVVLIWPDDMQFVVSGNWMQDCVEVLTTYPWFGSMGLNFLRRVTISSRWGSRRFFNWKRFMGEMKDNSLRFRTQRIVHSSGGFPFITYGWTESGVIGSGIPSLTRRQVWKTLGPWRTPGAKDIVDSSGGGEADMLARHKRSGMPLHRILPLLPVAADILTDDTGTKAKVRGSVRYGNYMAPPSGTYYYSILQQESMGDLTQLRCPLAFEDIVQPLGFELPLDSGGNLRKTSINLQIETSLL